MNELAPKRATSAKKKPRGKPFTGKNDPRTNLKGRPPTGESWSELIAQVGNMTGAEVASFAGVLGREFAKLPQGVTVKTLTVIRVFGALLNDPQPGLLNAFMERVEGKVKDQVEHSGEIAVTKSYVTISPDEWDQTDSDIQATSVANSAVARQVACPATDG